MIVIHVELLIVRLLLVKNKHDCHIKIPGSIVYLRCYYMNYIDKIIIFFQKNKIIFVQFKKK